MILRIKSSAKVQLSRQVKKSYPNICYIFNNTGTDGFSRRRDSVSGFSRRRDRKQVALLKEMPERQQQPLDESLQFPPVRPLIVIKRIA